ncbi:hypothetical protein [Fibrobacter intestinalis]|uniref:hypothetical protein n=1 Tax=Fibrobacter intestinalis TaxID=28122 RepID=UPI0023F1F659|nr:hypothetical protein [Fibrobacter intestinalis]MDD7298753.1 hypothetical protein [Fibrobacter intestinalis]
MGKRASRNDGMPARIAPPLCFGVFPVSHDLADDFWAFLRLPTSPLEIFGRFYVCPNSRWGFLGVFSFAQTLAGDFTSLRTPQG